MKKRLLGLVLVMALVVNLFSISAVAETYTKKIGENAYFEYNFTTKVLKIYGSGDYDPTYAISERVSEYHSIRLDMETLIFEEGITYVPSIDFSLSTSLKEIHLADTVERIENDAFSSSEALERVTGGYGIKYIGTSAFKNCSKLLSINIPKNAVVANDAFSGCPNLTINKVNNIEKINDTAHISTKNTEFIKLKNYLTKYGTTENNITSVIYTTEDDYRFTLLYDSNTDEIGLRINISTAEYSMISTLYWNGENDVLDLCAFFSDYSTDIIQVGITSVSKSEILNNNYKFDTVIIDIINYDGESILQQGSDELLASTKQAFINLFPPTIDMIRDEFSWFWINEFENISIDDQNLGFSTSIVPRQTLYTEDGRSAEFDKTQVEAQLAVGWYTEPVQRLYAVGKSKVFEKSKVEAQLKVGWYTEPVVNMYASDGRVRITKTSEIEAYEKVGWYYGKPVKMYALDGRTKWIGENRVAANEKVGWYYGEPTKMYAPDGRIITIGKNRVQEYINVGWYTNKADADSKAKDVKEAEKRKQDNIIQAIEHMSSAVDHIDAGVNTFNTGLEKVYSNLNSYSSDYTFYNPTYVHMQAIYAYALTAQGEFKKAQKDLKASYNIFSQYSDFDNVSEAIQQALKPINSFVSEELSTSNVLDKTSALSDTTTIIQHLKTAATYLSEMGY